MDFMLDPINLILLGIAAFVFWRLKSVLGTRTGAERPPFDPYSAPTAPTRTGPVDLPNSPETKPAPAEAPVWKGYAAEGSSLAAGLEAIRRADATFTVPNFIEGGKAAYELIVGAFASGQKPELKPLLTREVYDDFAAAIDARQKAGETLESRLVTTKKAEIVEALLSGRKASLTVRFTSDFISVRKSKTGEILDGDPQRIREIIDIWTFERDVTSRDPNWRLAATGPA